MPEAAIPLRPMPQPANNQLATEEKRLQRAIKRLHTIDVRKAEATMKKMTVLANLEYMKAGGKSLPEGGDSTDGYSRQPRWKSKKTTDWCPVCGEANALGDPSCIRDNIRYHPACVDDNTCPYCGDTLQSVPSRKCGVFASKQPYRT